MCESIVYEVRVRDVLHPKWAAYFAPFQMAVGADVTILTGPVQDQAELFGLLIKISNLGLWLISVNPLAGDQVPATG